MSTTACSSSIVGYVYARGEHIGSTAAMSPVTRKVSCLLLSSKNCATCYLPPITATSLQLSERDASSSSLTSLRLISSHPIPSTFMSQNLRHHCITQYMLSISPQTATCILGRRRHRFPNHHCSLLSINLQRHRDKRQYALVCYNCTPAMKQPTGSPDPDPQLVCVLPRRARLTNHCLPAPRSQSINSRSIRE